MGSLIALLLGLARAMVLGAVILMVISRLNLGLTVESFGAAFIASIVISFIGGIVSWLLTLIGFPFDNLKLIGALLVVVIAAVVLMISDRLLSGLKVNGFSGALIAAVAYGVGVFLINWVIGLFV
jgi:putative membrane protein